jgi:hypothetical protein
MSKYRMKKIIASILLASICVTPAYADSYREYHRHEYRDRSGVSTEGAIAIGIGGLLIGALIADATRDEGRNDRYEQRYIPRTVCQNEYARDRHGVPIYDYRGRLQMIQRCWQE